MSVPISLHIFRMEENASKMPFRRGDLISGTTHWPSATVEVVTAQPSSVPSTTIDIDNNVKKEHTRHHSESAADIPPTPPRPSLLGPRPVTSGGLLVRNQSDANSSHLPSVNLAKARKLPARNLGKGPPPSMSSFHAIDIEKSTKKWVVNQTALSTSSPLDEEKPLPAVPQESKSPVTPLIPPIRGFKTSRKSAEMNATSPHRTSMDQDDTLRALDGFNSQRPSHRDQEEQSSDDSDLFLKLAREEATGKSRSGFIRRVRARITSQLDLLTLRWTMNAFRSGL